jgi:uncharacterized membrane protein YkvA (DUF1232 family)
MATNGRNGSIVRSIQELGSFFGARIQQKVAASPLASSIAQEAAARVRAGIGRRPAAPAEVVAVSDRKPDETEEAPGEPRDPLFSYGLRSVAQYIPQIARLLWKLATDPRVAVRHKVVLGGAAAYLLAPFDIIPDRVPGLGQLDDFAVVVSALDIVLNRTPSEIVHEHWNGDPRVLENIRRAVGLASQLRGGNVRRWLLKNGV